MKDYSNPLTPAGEPTVLDLQDLSVAYHSDQGDILAVQEADFILNKAEVLSLVGESGCGKSTLGFALLRLLTWPGRITGGKAMFFGQDLFQLSDNEMRKLRGDRLSMIFQNPMNSLNPTESVGAQIAETITTHRQLSRVEVRERVIELLELVGIPGAKDRLDHYPHEFSGGMRQRVLIALALALDPNLLVADEPTTALDLTVQGQILWLLEDLQKQSEMAMVYITHNLAVASSISHQVAVMYSGWIVEYAPSDELFKQPAHPYTKGLMAAIPRTNWRDQRLTPIPGQPQRIRAQMAGCPFAPRCSLVTEICRELMPKNEEITSGHLVRCHHAG
jgi:oligopeptide/dipeptide ABC transporter ATP-binding protein